MLKQWLAFKYPVKNMHKEHIYVTSNVCILRIYRVEEFKNQYKALIDKSLYTKDSTELLNECKRFTEEVIKRIYYLKI